MTDVQHLTAFQKALLANFHVEGHDGDDPDHLPLALAGARQDPIYSPLLDKLGAECPDPDTASAIMTEAADRVETEAQAARGSTERWSELCLVMGRLRTAAADMWRADDEQRMAAWK